MEKFKFFLEKLITYLDPRKWVVMENPCRTAVKATALDNGGGMIEHNFHPRPPRVWGRFFTQKGAVKAIKKRNDERSDEDLIIKNIDISSKTIWINGYYT